MRISDTDSLREAVKAVAAEKWYLATVDGFSLEQTDSLVKQIVECSLPQVLAVAQDRVVGCCDILPATAKGFTHVGRLGMGVRPEWRRQGIGRRVFGSCLALARSAGIERVELEVFADDVGAVRVYDSFGFT